MAGKKTSSVASKVSKIPVQFLCGYMSRDGSMAIPARFEMASAFSNGLAPVKSEGRWGAIDSKGEWAISPHFEALGAFEHGVVPYREGSLWGLIDRKGERILSPVFDRILSVARDAMIVEVKGALSVVDLKGKELLSGFEDASPWQVDLNVAIAVRDGGVGLINTGGKWIVEPEYDTIYEFSEGFARVRKGEKFGYIDASGKLVIPCEWDDVMYGAIRGPDIGNFSEGRAIVARYELDPDDEYEQRAKNFGYIDTSGRLIYPCQLEYAQPYSDGLALVEIEGKRVYLGKDGKVALEPDFEPMGSFSSGLVCVEAAGNDSRAPFGFMDRSGKLVVEPIFSRPTEFVGGFAIGTLASGKMAIVDTQGKVLHRDLQVEPKLGAELVALRAVNPEWDQYQESRELGDSFEKALAKNRAALVAAMEKDEPALVKELKKALQGKKLGKDIRYVELAVYDIDEFSLTISAVSRDLNAEDPFGSDRGAKSPFKAMSKYASSGAAADPKSSKGLRMLSEFESQNGKLILDWIAEGWKKAGGEDLKLPAFAVLQDDSSYMELVTGRYPLSPTDLPK